MKLTALIFTIVIAFNPFTLSAAQDQPEKVDVAVIGGGLGGLTVAYKLLQLGRSPVVFTSHLGGAAFQGKKGDAWIPRNSWRHHETQRKIAQSLGCSTLDVNGEAKIEDLQCLAHGLIKELGPDRVRNHYQLVDIQKTPSAHAPVKLTYRDLKTQEPKTVIANGVEFAMRSDDLSNIKFTN